MKFCWHRKEYQNHATIISDIDSRDNNNPGDVIDDITGIQPALANVRRLEDVQHERTGNGQKERLRKHQKEEAAREEKEARFHDNGATDGATKGRHGDHLLAG